jgi:hypothetical protein
MDNHTEAYDEPEKTEFPIYDYVMNEILEEWREQYTGDNPGWGDRYDEILNKVYYSYFQREKG